jgi:hypothetical protein
MLAHCINPDCCAPLHSFSEGRLYQFEIVCISVAASDNAKSPFDEKPERQAAQYWLCGRCAAGMDLQIEPLQGLRVVPLAADGRRIPNPEERPNEDRFKQGHRC